MVEKKKKLYPFKFEEGTTVLDQDSVIANGFLAGNSIDDMLETYLADAVGIDILKYYRGDLPVTLSYNRFCGKSLLSTCPDDNTAFERYGVFGRSRLWYISSVGKGAKIYFGFKEPITPETFYNRCTAGTIADSLYSFEPAKGDCLFIKPGIVFATEGDIEVVEVAQNSPVSYTLYDMNGGCMLSERREYKYMMEIGEAIDIIDYTPVKIEDYLYPEAGFGKTIADGSHFVAGFMELKGERGVSPSSLGSCILYFCIDGTMEIKGAGNETYTIERGEMAFVPESMDDFTMAGNGVHILEVTIPQPPEEVDGYVSDKKE